MRLRPAIVALLAPALLGAQAPEAQAVRAVVDRMFTGMRSADSGAVRSVFVEGARFASIDARTTPPIVRYDSVGGWIRGIANSARRWDEQIYDVQVRVDGEVAQVWAPYTFYLDRRWRHCGTNTMELLKVGADWKITQLSDSRRREGCRDPLGTGPATPRPPEVAHSGGFVVTLGNDTLSAESFERAGNRVVGAIVRRVPRTLVVRYVMTLSPTGLPSRLEYNTRLADGSMLPNGARTVIVTFAGDSAVTEFVRDSTDTRRAAATNAYPELDGSVFLYGLPIAALNAMKRDSAMFVSYVPGAPQGTTTPVASRGSGSNRYWLYSFGSPIEVVTDDAGRVLSVDGSRTTLRIQSRVQATVDVAALATSFAQRERATGPMVALSLRDSAVATIGNARVTIDYGRPATRGRAIWGPNGVLGDTLWRTGANASTKFRTDAALSIGGRALPAGLYTITTLAVPGRYQLIFSASDVEVLRVPLRATPIAPSVERFTILIDAGTLRLRWDTLELSAPLSVPR